MHPHGAKRQSPISAVFVTNGDVDHLTGLLTLREQQSFTVYGSKTTLAEVTGGNIFGVLNRDLVKFNEVELGQTVDTGIGLRITLVRRAGQGAALS